MTHTCPMCQGRKVTGRFKSLGCRSDNQKSVLTDFLGMINMRVIGRIVDGPCGTCQGTGKVSADTLARLTGQVPEPSAQ